MSIIVFITDDEVFRHYDYYHERCFPQWMEGDIHKVNSIEERHKCCECHEWIEAEKEGDPRLFLKNWEWYETPRGVELRYELEEL